MPLKTLQTLQTPIRAFQTGRGYTRQGQRIAWAVTCVFEDGWSEVSFYDHDRFIEGRSVLPKAPEAMTEAVPVLPAQATLALPRKGSAMRPQLKSQLLAWHIGVDPRKGAPDDQSSSHCLPEGGSVLMSVRSSPPSACTW